VALVIDVPLNTMLADLDETLRVLLRRELARHGFDGVVVEFDAPSREWSGQLSAPTVDLFLYDLRESEQTRVAEWEHVVGNGGARDVRPPLTMECTYAVTAWTQAVEDEHRLLSQVLAILFAYRRLPADALHGRLANGAQRFPVEGRVGGAKSEGKADFWNAVGGQYKASLDYVVGLTVESGSVLARGPEVRTQTVVTRERTSGPSAVLELHRVGGRVTDADGAPLPGVWVTLPDTGAWAASDGAGRFRLERVPTGTHRCVARDREGREAEAQLHVPGAGVELVLGGSAPKARRRARG
jgi:hypothetical protein